MFFIKIGKFPSTRSLVSIFIINRCWVLSDTFSASIDTIRGWFSEYSPLALKLEYWIPQDWAGANGFLLAPAAPYPGPVPPAFDDPYALVVLAEEELVVIDLRTAGWPPVRPPYLASLHCSAITCSHHVSNIPLKLWERIIAAGSRQDTHSSTMVGTAPAPPPPWWARPRPHLRARRSRALLVLISQEWPIDGGTSLAPAPPQRDLLLTG